MAVEFEASKEIIGGSWYVEGKLDVEFIKLLKDLCLKHIDKLEVVTMEGLFDYFRRSGILKVELSSHQIVKILQALVLDNEVEEVKSTGKGVFSSVPLGKFCYRRLSGRNPMGGIMSSIPCGVCPRSAPLMVLSLQLIVSISKSGWIFRCIGGVNEKDITHIEKSYWSPSHT